MSSCLMIQRRRYRRHRGVQGMFGLKLNGFSWAFALTTLAIMPELATEAAEAALAAK